MPWVDIPAAGSLGLLTDLPSSELPPAGWTDGANVRMHDNEVVAFPGHVQAAINPTLDRVWGLTGATSEADHFWVHAGPASAGGALTVNAFDGTSYYDITPAGGMSGGASDLFVGAMLNQQLVVTNGADVPYYWSLNTSDRMLPLPGWDAQWKCRHIGAFKGFLIALNLEETGTAYPYRVRWSDEAPPGGLPTSWDAIDPTKLAGARDVAGTEGALVGGQALRDQYIIYTEKTAVAMRLGGPLVWTFNNIAREAGLLATRALAAFRGHHLVVTDGDVVVNNGQTVQSLIDAKRRRWLFNTIDTDNVGLTFCVVNQPRNEVWVCFPQQGFNYCNLASVYNWQDSTWGVRDLPEGCYAGAEALDIVGLVRDTWAMVPGVWPAQTYPWFQRSYDITQNVVLLGGESSGAGAPLYRAEVGDDYAGSPRRARVERVGMQVSGDQVVTVHELWPRVTGSATCQIRIGGHDSPTAPVSWSDPVVFRPGVDSKITRRVSGRYVAVEFQTDEAAAWALQGYRMRYSTRARR